MTSRWTKILPILAFLAVLMVSAAPVRADSPRNIIERFNAALLSVMQNAETLKFTGRYETLQPVLLKSFDIPFMAKFSAGSHWRKLSKDERQTLVRAFGRLWVSTYADRFKGYSGEAFEIAGEQEAPRETVLVKTNIIKSDGEAVPINYLMRKNRTNWAVIDIFLKGKFSELAKQRAEYTAVLDREGIQGLVAKVDDRIHRMELNGD